MRPSTVCFSLLFVAAAPWASAQGTLAQLAYGGCWQTTFTFVNTSNDLGANVTLSFYGDDGKSLSAPVQGAGNVSPYQFNIPPGGAKSVVLASTDAATTQGWASMTTVGSVPVRGQGSFRCHFDGKPDFEAVVPLNLTTSSACILPFPAQASPVILVPFDNTTSQYVTSLAFANTSSSSQTVQLEFDSQANIALASDTLTLGAMNHTAFSTVEKYPKLVGAKGILRVSASPQVISVLALLFNSSGPFTTIMPVNQ